MVTETTTYKNSTASNLKIDCRKRSIPRPKPTRKTQIEHCHAKRLHPSLHNCQKSSCLFTSNASQNTDKTSHVQKTSPILHPPKNLNLPNKIAVQEIPLLNKPTQPFPK